MKQFCVCAGDAASQPDHKLHLAQWQAGTVANLNYNLVTEDDFEARWFDPQQNTWSIGIQLVSSFP